MKRLLGIVSIVAVMLAMVCGCRKVPDGVLDKERMARLMADLYIGEGVVESNVNTYITDSSKRALRQAIYARNGVSSEEVDSSLRWYGYHMEEYVEVYDRVLEMLNADLASVEEIGGASAQVLANQNGISVEGDSVDVWFDSRYRPFAANLPSDRLIFTFRTDPNWEPGDRYRFRTKLTGNSRPARFVVAVEYTNGVVETHNAIFNGDGWQETTFALDSVYKAREIFGELRYDAAAGETAFADSISLVRTRMSPANAAIRAAMGHLGAKRHSISFD